MEAPSDSHRPPYTIIRKSPAQFCGDDLILGAFGGCHPPEGLHAWFAMPRREKRVCDGQEERRYAQKTKLCCIDDDIPFADAAVFLSSGVLCFGACVGPPSAEGKCAEAFGLAKCNRNGANKRSVCLVAICCLRWRYGHYA